MGAQYAFDINEFSIDELEMFANGYKDSFAKLMDNMVGEDAMEEVFATVLGFNPEYVGPLGE